MAVPAPVSPPPKVEPPTDEDASPAADTTLIRKAPQPAFGSDDEPSGSTDGQLWVRTRRDELVLLPTARLEVDGSTVMAVNRYVSGKTLALNLARIDAAGWIVSKVFFDLSADFAAGPSLRHVDNFVGVAPWGDRAIFQIGQFDVPFTLENRTSDRYLDFIGRGAAVRAFAVPENKDQGLLLHGTNPDRNYYYSAAILNGEGPAVTGVDGQLDVMARGWVAPFSFRGREAWRRITVGGSAWTGDRVMGPLYAGQRSQGGYSVLDPSVWWRNGGPPGPLAVRERGRLYALAFELNAPFGDRFGARVEWIGKRQPYSAVDVTNPDHPQVVGGLDFSGWATYAEVWGWVLGDARLLGAPAAPGLELPVRLRDFVPASPKNGLMLAARVDYVDEEMAPTAYSSAVGLGAASAGTTKLTALTLGVSYWYSRRAHLDANYVFNHVGGTSPFLIGLGGKNEQELLVRTAFAL